MDLHRAPDRLCQLHRRTYLRSIQCHAGATMRRVEMAAPQSGREAPRASAETALRHNLGLGGAAVVSVCRAPAQAA